MPLIQNLLLLLANRVHGTQGVEIVLNLADTPVVLVAHYSPFKRARQRVILVEQFVPFAHKFFDTVPNIPSVK